MKMKKFLGTGEMAQYLRTLLDPLGPKFKSQHLHPVGNSQAPVTPGPGGFDTLSL